MGKCPECNKWNSMVEEVREAKTTSTPVNSLTTLTGNASVPKSIGNIKSGEKERIDTGVTELNRVLGGGLVKGSLTLISGAPGRCV